MNKYLKVSQAKAFLLNIAIALALSTSLSANIIEQKQLTDLNTVIVLLENAREENAKLANKASELFDQTEKAIEELNLFKMIDVILQACLYTTERIKHYQPVCDDLSRPEEEHVEMVI